MMLKTAIIITCFNKQHSITKTIESAVSQINCEEHYEIIVVDDCSTDNSVEEIQNFKQVNLVQNKENLGTLQSIFIGLEKTHADLIILLDGDDLLVCNAVEIISKFLFKNPNCALYTRCERFDDRNTQLYKTPIKDYKITRTFRKAINIIRLSKTGTSAFAFYKKDLLKIKNEVPPVLIQDHIIPCMLSRNIKTFFFSDALTHIAINWKKDSHITSNKPQLEHDKLEYLWQCIQSERSQKNHFFDFYFRGILLKKILKRDKRFNLNIKLGFAKTIRAIFNIQKLEQLKIDAMKCFREKYSIKYYE